MATVIKASCHDCGDVELAVNELSVRVLLLSHPGSYVFRCPTCQMSVSKPAEQRIIDLLVASGVELIEWRLPAELFEAHGGQPITLGRPDRLPRPAPVRGLVRAGVLRWAPRAEADYGRACRCYGPSLRRRDGRVGDRPRPAEGHRRGDGRLRRPSSDASTRSAWPLRPSGGVGPDTRRRCRPCGLADLTRKYTRRHVKHRGGEFLVIALVALIVLGPERPATMPPARLARRWVSCAGCLGVPERAQGCVHREPDPHHRSP